METSELINALRECYTKDMPFEQHEMIIAAADKLEQLQGFIDDLLGDHYVDYLEFYANRCRELEDELAEQNKI